MENRLEGVVLPNWVRFIPTKVYDDDYGSRAVAGDIHSGTLAVARMRNDQQAMECDVSVRWARRITAQAFQVGLELMGTENSEEVEVRISADGDILYPLPGQVRYIMPVGYLITLDRFFETPTLEVQQALTDEPIGVA